MRQNRIGILPAVVLLLCFVLCVPASASADWAARWDNVIANGSVVSLSPGCDETQIRFRFLAPIGAKPAFRLGAHRSLTDADAFPVQQSVTFGGKICCTVTADGLSGDTTYYYALRTNGTWSETYSFHTAGDTLTALFVSDSQLGRSGDWRDKDVLLHDVAGWDATLNAAKQAFPDISLCLSAGDQTEIGFSEKQYRLFLAPDEMRALPIATTIGNHEFYYPLLNLHFAHPNRFVGSILHSLGDEPYYFCQNNVLFIVLDSNDPIAWDHEILLERAVQAHPDAAWRVVMMHHSLYSCEDSFEDAPSLRKTLAPLLQKYGVDLVLSGHTHRYSRSYPVWDDALCEDGITYLEGGCCSGCNCKASPETLPSYTAAGYPQTDPVYSVLRFSDDEIRIEAFAVKDGTGVLMDSGTVTAHHSNGEDAHSPLFVRVLQGVLSVFGRAVSVFFR